MPDNILTRLSGAFTQTANSFDAIAQASERRKTLETQRENLKIEQRNGYFKFATDILNHATAIEDPKARTAYAEKMIPVANRFLGVALPDMGVQLDPAAFKTSAASDGYGVLAKFFEGNDPTITDSMVRTAVAPLFKDPEKAFSFVDMIKANRMKVGTPEGTSTDFGTASTLVKGSGGGMQVAPGEGGELQLSGKPQGGDQTRASALTAYNNAVQKEIDTRRKLGPITDSAIKQIQSDVFRTLPPETQNLLRSNSQPQPSAQPIRPLPGASSSSATSSVSSPSPQNSSSASGVVVPQEPGKMNEKQMSDLNEFANAVKGSSRIYDDFINLAQKNPEAFGAVGGTMTELKGGKKITNRLVRGLMGSNPPEAQQLYESLKQLLQTNVKMMNGLRASDQERAYAETYNPSVIQDKDVLGTFMNATAFQLDKATSLYESMKAQNMNPAEIERVGSLVKNLSVRLEGIRNVAASTGKALNQPMDQLGQSTVDSIANTLREPLMEVQKDPQIQQLMQEKKQIPWELIVSKLPVEIRSIARSIGYSPTQIQQVQKALAGGQ